MQNSSFKIYSASAGSGKTYTLAKVYLKQLVISKNLEQFKYILALTFTNKAVGEMKTRIIEMLKRFSSKENFSNPHPMFRDLCDELLVSSEFLRNKSTSILKHIIHNYGAFDISTIDGFTHRIIRTFAHDLKLPVNFEVELDQERLLSEAVDRLIAKAGTDEALTNVLVDFAIEKTDDDKSWDISFDFYKIAKLLVNENDLSAIKTLKNKTFQDFKQLKAQLQKENRRIESTIIKIAETTLNLISECGLEFDDFNRKSLPNYFKNLQQKKFNQKFDVVWQTDLVEGNTLYPKRVTEIIASTINEIQSNLSKAYKKTKTLIFEQKLKKGFYKHCTPLSVLNAIKNELNALKIEQNKMLISEFNTIISNEIKDQPTPFIYERLGEKFKHYFIDEFQDTSKMQWHNLIPLLDNSLSGINGSTMLVGDAKQAIYRWRGGEAEQFINLYNKTENPFQVEAETLTLDTNYRSAKEIVSFNNSFFEFLSATYFSNNTYSELYKNANQNSNSEIKGFINLNFLDLQKEDDSNELYSKQVLNTIKKCQENGYSLSDICVIVRKRKEGVAIANYLNDHKIKVTSSETLLLKNADSIVFINTFLNALTQPENEIHKINILNFIANQQLIEDKHRFFATYLKKDLNTMFKSLETLDIFINKNEVLQLSLYELVEEIIRVFKLNKTPNAYLQFYMDIVLEFTQKQNFSLAAFLEYFEKNKEHLSIVSSEQTNAVKIITIHKSKGLEFPVVIFPFADLNIYKELDPKVWFPVDKEMYSNFNTLLLNFNKDLAHFGDIGKTIYDTRQSQLELDNINLLYVVLTRAIEQLYVISKKDISSKGITNKNSYAGMFISYLQSTNNWRDNQLEYSFGEQMKKTTTIDKKVILENLKFISTPKEDHNLNVITNAGLLWDTQQEKAIERGNLAHLILSKIKTVYDLDFALNDLISSGDITKDHLDELRLVALDIVMHPKLKTYYQDDFKVYNERDIITNTGKIIRPDRLCINSKGDIVIIDYKTGEKKSHHKVQLNDYEAVLNKMNLKVLNKILVYINDTIDVVEV